MIKKLNLVSKKFFLILLTILVFITIHSNNVKTNAEIISNDDSYYSLLDDYYIQNKNQGFLGVCWSFAATRSLETAFAKKINEFYSFSEAGVSILTKGEIGGGALFMSHYYWSEENGILLEQDFPYENLMYVTGDYNSPNSNVKQYLEYTKNLRTSSIYKNVNFKELQNESKQIKNHIKNEGSVYIEILNYQYSKNEKNNTYYLEYNKRNRDHHAVSLVGWDDNYTLPNGEKGAYIALNSNSYHSYDSIIHIPYSCKSTTSPYGYIVNEKNIIKSRKNNDFLDNPLYLKNSTKSNFESKKGKKLLNNNIFSYDQLVDISYINPNNLNISIEVLYDNENVNNLFQIIREENDYRLKSKTNLKAGKYKVKLKYNVKEKQYDEIREIFVTDYTEMNIFETYFSRKDNNFDYKLTKNQLLTNNNDFILINNLNNEKATFYIRPNLYHKIKSYSINDGNENYIENKVLNSIEIVYDFKNKNVGVENSYITFTLEDGKKITKKIIAHFLDKNENYTFPSVIYDKDNAYTTKKITNFLPFKTSKKNSSSDKFYFTTFEKPNNKLIGYELNGTNSYKYIVTEKDENGFYIEKDVNFLNKFRFQGNNYATKKGSAFDYQYTIFAKPIFEKDEENIEFNELNISLSKNTFTALETINKEDLNVIATKDNKNYDVTLVDIKYMNEKFLQYGDSHITLTLKYNNKEYDYIYSNLQINKKIVNFEKPEITSFKFDNNEHTLEIKESNLYTFTNNKNTLPGKYITKINIKDQRNCIFENGEQEIIIEWEITKPKYTNFKITSKNETTFYSLSTLDINDFEASCLIDEAPTKVIIKSLSYQTNNNYLTINDTYVTFELFYLNEKIADYKHIIKVNKNIIEFSEPNIKSFYFDNTEKNLSITSNSKYIINNNSQKNIGKYETTVEIIDKENYVFDNKETTIKINWEIKEPLKENIQVYNNENNAQYYSLSTLNINDFTAKGKMNNFDTDLKILEIKYNQNKSLNIEDTYVIFVLDYNTYIFEYQFNLIVEKNKITFDLPKIKTFIYDGNPKQLNIPINSKYEIIDSIKTNVGKYKTTVRICDNKNYTFENNEDIITINWEIKSRGIINLNINSQKSIFPSLSKIDKDNFTVTADLDGVIINLDVLEIKYKNNSNLQINDKFVTLKLNYKEYFLEKQFEINVEKNILNFNMPENLKFIYDGKPKKPEIKGDIKYTILNNSQTDAGKYESVVVINDTTNYSFKNDLLEIKISWEIEKAKINYKTNEKNKIYFTKQDNLLYSYDLKNWLPYTNEIAVNIKYEKIYFKINDNYEEISFLTKDLANFKASKSNGTIIGVFALMVSLGLITTLGIIYYIKNKKRIS